MDERNATTNADALIEKKALELLAAEYERDGHLGVAHTIRYGYGLTPAQDKRLAAIAAALRSAQVPDGVAWRDQYRIQTAMRYMDNAPRLTLDEAYRMADHDIRGLERAAAKRVRLER